MRKFLIGLLLLCAVRPAPISCAADFPEEIPFVPTPIDVVDRMLQLASVKKSDVVYDLGSGDGRIVIRAAQKYGARAVGIEMDELLLKRRDRTPRLPVWLSECSFARKTRYKQTFRRPPS